MTEIKEMALVYISYSDKIESQLLYLSVCVYNHSQEYALYVMNSICDTPISTLLAFQHVLTTTRRLLHQIPPN